MSSIPVPARQRILPFTGLIPVLLMVPVLAFNLYALAILLGIGAGLCVIAFHLRQNQGVTSLDLVLLSFTIVNAILYFGFDNAFLVNHIDAVIYTALAVQALASLRGPTPWTVQFTKRVTSPAVWERPEFLAMNRTSTLIWTAGFIACDAIAVQPWRLYAPIALMICLAVVSRQVARRQLARQLGLPVDALPSEWTPAASSS